MPENYGRNTSALTARGITKSYQGRVILDDISLDVPCDCAYSLTGPSGEGKTTFLRLLAGLESPDSGYVGDAKVLMVFQDYQLFPHMTVRNNVGFGLRAEHMPKGEISDRTDSILNRLGIQDRADMYPAYLSGGERQRTALARALVLEPEWLLLDEPFANLDHGRKKATAEFIRELCSERRTGLMMVTHDLPQALLVSDRIGVLLGGSIVADGDPLYIRENPYFGTIGDDEFRALKTSETTA